MTSAERLLMGSGPSNAPPEVLQALGRPLVGLMDPSFLAVLDEVSEQLRTVFQTQNRMTFAVSGTGSAGMEAALTNIVEPGDEVIVGINGVFGGRMAEVVRRAGGLVVPIEAPWGEVIPWRAVQEQLRAHPRAKAVSVVHAETSTGVAQPMEELASVVDESDALLVLDTVTSLSGMPVYVDAWGVDVAYAGTQKCLSVPPGLAPITFSDRALKVVREREKPPQSWYLDVTLLEEYWQSDQGGRVYHHTPPIAMIRALHAGLQLVIAEGLEARWTRHASVGAQLQKELGSRGFEYVADSENRLPMLHCVRVPAGIDEAAARARLLESYGIEISAGLGPFKGQCWRIGLMGYSCSERNVLTLLAALDDVLRR